MALGGDDVQAAERDKVLRNEDLTQTVRSFVDDELEALVDERLSSAVV